MFKPMLASPIVDTSKLKFPVLASIKLDGIRATVQGGKLISRSLKLIPNIHIQKKFGSVLPEGFDGELIYGDPSHPDCFRTTTSIVMSEDKDPAGIKFHAFDINNNLPFREREQQVYETVFHIDRDDIEQVLQKEIQDEETLLAYEADALACGHEGIMVRSMDGPYKEGRSTPKEGYLLKLKRFLDSEAEILEVLEQMHNANEAKTNELGRTERSSAKDGMVPAGVMGKFAVRDLTTNVEFEVGTGPNADERKQFWKDRSKLVGKIIKYKYFPTGSKDKPRFPVYLGFRDRRDM